LPDALATTRQQFQAFASSDDYGAYTILLAPVDSAALVLVLKDSLNNGRIQQVLLAQQGRLLKCTTFNPPAGSGG
jgi:hypothetical protein